MIIEKQPQKRFEKAGYMLGLLPLGGRVLNALGKRDEYLARSCSMQEYTIYNGHGSALNTYSLSALNNRFGRYRGISRNALISILRSSPDMTIRFNTTINDLRQNEDEVTATFSDGSVHPFHLVVIADGLHSRTKSLILDKSEFSYTSTGWGGWVSWIDPVPGFLHSYNEYWGAGSFLGLYPVKDQIGAFLGGPTDKLKKVGRRSFVEKVESSFSDPNKAVEQAVQSFKELEKPYFWDFHDCKCERWKQGRVILLGDAAMGFLPTAGIGASMAMDSAAALADELSRADDNHVQYALQLYENRQRPKVEKAQKESRKLGKWGFVDSRIKAWLRNRLVKFYSLGKMLQGFEDIMMGT